MLRAAIGFNMGTILWALLESCPLGFPEILTGADVSRRMVRRYEATGLLKSEGFQGHGGYIPPEGSKYPKTKNTPQTTVEVANTDTISNDSHKDTRSDFTVSRNHK